MRYRQLEIHTQREAPNNAKNDGAAWLIRAGYLSRDGEFLPLGGKLIERIQMKTLEELDLPLLINQDEAFFPCAGGSVKILHCPACVAVSRVELAAYRKMGFPQEAPLQIAKVYTPECNSTPRELYAADLLRRNGKIYFGP